MARTSPLSRLPFLTAVTRTKSAVDGNVDLNFHLCCEYMGHGNFLKPE